MNLIKRTLIGEDLRIFHLYMNIMSLWYSYKADFMHSLKLYICFIFERARFEREVINLYTFLTKFREYFSQQCQSSLCIDIITDVYFFSVLIIHPNLNTTYSCPLLLLYIFLRPTERHAMPCSLLRSEYGLSLILKNYWICKV